jgi:23S rRNA pseudouridine1911/1915/1917 synthase
VLFCRTSKAAGRMSAQFRTGVPRKTYLAVLEGRMTSPGGHLTHHIERREERSSRIVPSPTPSSQEARLSFRLLDTGNARSLVEVELETGRHHQIRVQMASLGHPVVGDLRYGASAPMPQKQIALIARELIVNHPVRGETMRFLSPFPRGWPWPNAEEDNSPPWNWNELHPLIGTRRHPSEPHPASAPVL